MVDELLEEVLPTSSLGAFDEAMKEELATLGCVEDLLNAFVDKQSIQVSNGSCHPSRNREVAKQDRRKLTD